MSLALIDGSVDGGERREEEDKRGEETCSVAALPCWPPAAPFTSGPPLSRCPSSPASATAALLPYRPPVALHASHSPPGLLLRPAPPCPLLGRSAAPRSSDEPT
uniref:Uncharacterized protein n=1 Tax=Oryza glumipatula TaxID=40148 RepID=A0A0D9YKS6_9ORYZ